MKAEESFIKSVIKATVDRGLDKNSLFQKVISFTINHFKKLELDGIFHFIVCNAPERSTYNRIESQMASLGQELSALILFYDHYSSHLNDNDQIIDEKIEQNNFAYAHKILLEIWISINIYGYPVTDIHVD